MNSRYDPTIEDSYSLTRTVDGVTYNLSITDTAGQDEYRGMWTTNLSSDAFLLVYDITNSPSLDQCADFDTHIQIEIANRVEQRQCWPACMVVGNKCDLASSREVSAKDGLDWARARGYGFMETSAREMVNVEETITALVRRVVQARQMHAKGLTPDAAPSPARISAPDSARDSPRHFDEKAGNTSRSESPHLWTKQSAKPGPRTRVKEWWATNKCW